jgi:rhomboid family GlyGly-CTERM serine protease
VNRVRGVLESLNCDGRLGFALAAVCVGLLLPTLWGEAGRLALRYDRTALGAGELWRLLTAHWVHLNLRHALVNALGLVLLWALFARDYSGRQWLLIVLASILAIDAGLWLLDKTVEWYVGSSGALHGVMAAGTLAQLRRGHREGWILALILTGKLIYEQVAGPLPFSGSAAVVVNAHLYGVAGALVAALALHPQSVPL